MRPDPATMHPALAYPWSAPRRTSVLLPTGYALAVREGVDRSLPSLLPNLYVGTVADPRFSAVKGQITETMMSRVVLNGFLEGTGGWLPCTPRLAPQGIDGLYVRMDARGSVSKLLVAEAKYGSAKLAMTKMGRQMSTPWIHSRLRGAAALYREVADRLGEHVYFSARVPPGATTLSVPLGRGRSAELWKDIPGQLHAYSAHPTSQTELQRRARSLADYFEKATKREVSYRARVFRCKSSNNRIRFQMYKVDTGGRQVGTTDRIQGRFDDLGWRVKRAYLQGLEERFQTMGLDSVDARALSLKSARDPEFLRTLCRSPRWRPAAGFDLRGLAAAGGAAAFAAAADVFLELFRTGQPDWKRASQLGLAAGASSWVGYVAGVQLHAVLVGTEVGRNVIDALPTTIGGRSTSAVVSSASAGVITAVAYVVVLRALGLLDDRQAGRMLAGSLTGAGAAAIASAATMATVMAFGTAGTGVAISTLSGAAATNAALAVLGGGTVAAGGFGIALGSVVLSGGTAVVGLAAAVALHLAFTTLDDREQRRLIEGRMTLIEERLRRGTQPEWA